MEKQFAQLFRGLNRAHGLLLPTDEVSARGKHQARYKTVRAAVPPIAWQRHLQGIEGLVITPVDDEGRCWFGAIDVDVYGMDVPDLARLVAGLGLPLVTCRTKSGGAHLYLFLKSPGPAESVQRQLRRWAAALGHPKSEVFPKQFKLANENDLGSGINLPYFGEGRRAIRSDGAELSLSEFLDLAEASAVDPERLTGGGKAEDAPEEPGREDVPTELEGAPPCLCHWAKEGIGEGSRNEVMFDFAVYCRKRWDGKEDWRARLEQINQAYCRPPLTATELLAVFKSVSHKTYTYKAKCEGPYCDKKKCRKRAFGLGGGYEELGFQVGAVTVVETTPKLAILTINGRNVEFAYEALRDQRLFAAVLFEEVELFHKPLKPELWEKEVLGWLARADRQTAPTDASPDGQLVQHLDHYRRRFPGKAREELRLDGRSWYDAENKRTYFKARDILAYLRKERAGPWQAPDLYQAIRRLGGDKEHLTLQGERLTVWWVPMEPEVTTAVPVPGAKKDDHPF